MISILKVDVQTMGNISKSMKNNWVVGHAQKAPYIHGISNFDFLTMAEKS